MVVTSTLLSYFGAICGCIAVIPQIVRVIRIKNAYAISYLFLAIRMVAFFSFMLAIAMTGHFLMASSYSLIIAANGYLAFLKFYYTKKP